MKEPKYRICKNDGSYYKIQQWLYTNTEYNDLTIFQKIKHELGLFSYNEYQWVDLGEFTTSGFDIIYYSSKEEAEKKVKDLQEVDKKYSNNWVCEGEY